jgi:hypothetical protein
MKKLFSPKWIFVTILLLASLVAGLLSITGNLYSLDYDSGLFMIWFGGVGLIVLYVLVKKLDVPGR